MDTKKKTVAYFVPFICNSHPTQIHKLESFSSETTYWCQNTSSGLFSEGKADAVSVMYCQRRGSAERRAVFVSGALAPSAERMIIP